jgi:hypothetical protein
MEKQRKENNENGFGGSLEMHHNIHHLCVQCVHEGFA